MRGNPTHHRSGLFILSFQLDGLATALRYTVPAGAPVGPETIKMAMRLKSAFERVTSGEPVENLPDVSIESAPSDVLMLVEILRASLLAFLSPDEAEERRDVLGFRASPDSSS